MMQAGWRWWATVVVFGVAGLYGCAQPGSAPLPAPAAPSASTDLMTESDEPESLKRARIRLELAAGYLEQNQTTVALDEVKQALTAEPSYAAAHNLRGLIYLRLNQPALAQTSFEQALRLAPQDADVLHNLGWLHCQQARYPEAQRHFERALQVPQYAAAARTWMAQGVCQARAGQLAEAERSLTRSFELDAANPITTYNLAALLLRRGELERARFYVRRLNNSELANAESLWLGMRVEQRLGNAEAVRQLGEQLRRRFPDSRERQAYEQGSFYD